MSTTVVITVVSGCAVFIAAAIIVARLVRKAEKARALAAEVEAHRRMSQVDANRSMPSTAQRLRDGSY